MIFIVYLILAVAVIFFSIKASIYVDLIDKKTNLGGAFIGGVMLSAVTSLPELFTSLSSTLLINKPALCLGNILGSNLFNTAVLGLLIIIFVKSFSKIKVTKSHYITLMALFTGYFGLCLTNFGLRFSFINIEWISVVILALYVIALKKMANDGDNEPEFIEEVEFALEHDEIIGNSVSDQKRNNLTLKQITIRFILTSIMIVIVSIAITFATDTISIRLHLNAGLAGALLLGVATSLPEVTSTFTLFKMKNFNIGIGNIIGSNLFNLTILSVVDILYFGKGLYDFSDSQTNSLLFYGLFTFPLFALAFKTKKKIIKVISSIIIILLYIGFLFS